MLSICALIGLSISISTGILIQQIKKFSIEFLIMKFDDIYFVRGNFTVCVSWILCLTWSQRIEFHEGICLIETCQSWCRACAWPRSVWTLTWAVWLEWSAWSHQLTSHPQPFAYTCGEYYRNLCSLDQYLWLLNKSGAPGQPC